MHSAKRDVRLAEDLSPNVLPFSQESKPLHPSLLWLLSCASKQLFFQNIELLHVGGLVWYDLSCYWASQVALVVKNLPAKAGDVRDAGLIPGSGRSPGWQPTPVFWPREPGGQRSLAGCGPQCCRAGHGNRCSSARVHSATAGTRTFSRFSPSSQQHDCGRTKISRKQWQKAPERFTRANKKETVCGVVNSIHWGGSLGLGLNLNTATYQMSKYMSLCSLWAYARCSTSWDPVFLSTKWVWKYFFFLLLWILTVMLGLSLVGACGLLLLRSTGSRAGRLSSLGMWA